MDADKIVRDFCAAFGRGDVDAIVNSFTDDAPVCGVFELAPDGRIQAWRDYFDVAQFSGASTPAGT
jgi:limonene-1,2-epoxide hydrolase